MKQLLVVEDDPDIRFLLEDILTRAGYLVSTAADGREGLKLLRAAPKDLVITDIYMPEQDGFETIMAIRREFPDVKVVAMSGVQFGAEFSSLKVANQLGAHGVLAKPFQLQEVLDLVDQLL